MAEPTDTDYRACIDAVLQLYGDVSGQFEVDADNEIKFRVCFPLAMCALNQLYVTTKIADMGREFLATANVRVALEHAVTAQWVLYTEGAEERLVGSMKRNNQLMVKSVVKHAAEAKQPLPATLTTEFGRNGDSTMPSFKDRCVALEGTEDALYFLYRSLSTAVHPSIVTLSQHLTIDEDGVPRGIKFGAAEPPPTDIWGAAAISALGASFTIEALRKGQPRLQQAIDLGVSVGLPGSLKTA